MARFRPGFHSSLASRMVEDIFYGRKSLWMTLGYIQPWGEFTDDKYVIGQCDCDCPDCVNANGTLITMDFGDKYNPHKDPSDEYFHETTIRGNIIYVSKITADNISVVIPGYKWQKGNYYTQWDNTQNMRNLSSDQPFYVYNSDFQVFKCVYNNKTMTADGTMIKSPSLYEPRGVNYDIIETPDGYWWKYMYTIPMSIRSRFVGSGMIPVQRAVQSTFYNRGAIEEIIVVEHGSGYSEDPKVTLSVDPPKQSDGVSAELKLSIDPDSGSIVAVHIVNPGSGYYQQKVNDNNQLVFDGAGNPVMEQYAPSIKIVDAQHTGKGKYDNPAAVLTAQMVDGSIDNVLIVDPGINYTPDTMTTIVISGDGEGAKAYPKIVNGVIEGVVVTDPGSGYTYADIVASCAKNQASIIKATFKTKLGGEIIDVDQGVVEQMAVPGQICAIELTVPGLEYTNNTQVIIDGDGEGAKAHVEVSGSSITKVVVDDPGSGYTRANISFKDKNRREPNPNPEAQAYAILPPMHGHGFNPVEELYGEQVAMYTSIRNDNLLAGFNQDFRQFALIEDLKTINTKASVMGSEAVVVFDITTEPIANISSNMNKDSVVYIGKTPYMIVDVNTNSGRFKLQQISSIFREVTNNDVLTYTDPNTSVTYNYAIESVNSMPTIDKYSGTMLYASNNAPFFMESNKTLGLRTIIKF